MVARRWAHTISGENSMVLYHLPEGIETTCHLCLRETRLTDEHIPPRRAFNDCRRVWERFNHTARPQHGSARQTRRDVWQGGFYVRTLCQACNNETGASSAKAYVHFAKAIAEAPRLFAPADKHRTVRVPEDTLLLARQIAVMILAVEDREFAILHDDLRRLLAAYLTLSRRPFVIEGYFDIDLTWSLDAALALDDARDDAE